MEKEKISVIIPVYNGVAWLEACVDSVLAQTYPNFEVLILDDNSTDGTTEIARQLEKRDSRVRLTNRYRKGVSSARNQGIEETSGEFITFVDADDKLDLKMFETLLQYLKNENVDIVVCDYMKWNGKDDTQFHEKIENAIKIEKFCNIDRNSYLSDYLLQGNTRCWSILYRRSVIGAVRFQENLTIGEDMMFLMDLLPNLNRVGITDYKGYFYRINQAGVMLRPFTPSYMDEVHSWQLACDMIQQRYPEQKAKAYSILAVSAMLVAGKLSRLSAEQRKEYREYISTCQQTVKQALSLPGVKELLPEGYGVKTLLFGACPAVYLNLYHLWKRRTLE